MSDAYLALVPFMGLLAGLTHVASGPDHLAAIAPFAVNAKTQAWRAGVRWGFGHSAGVVGVGVLALLLRDTFNIDLVSMWGERFVGVMLVGIGVWGLFSVANGKATAAHRQAHLAERPHQHKHPAFAVGTVHGLAGSSHLLGVIPALALPSDSAALVYLLLFGVGSIAAMGTFSSLIGWVAGRSGVCGVSTRTALMVVSSVIAVVIGLGWLFVSLQGGSLP
jgi:hypothetical protein